MLPFGTLHGHPPPGATRHIDGMRPPLLCTGGARDGLGEILSQFRLKGAHVLVGTPGIFTILVGYILMYSGETYSFLSTSLSPLILIIGYCFIIPFSILYNFKKTFFNNTILTVQKLNVDFYHPNEQ